MITDSQIFQYLSVLLTLMFLYIIIDRARESRQARKDAMNENILKNDFKIPESLTKTFKEKELENKPIIIDKNTLYCINCETANFKKLKNCSVCNGSVFKRNK